MLCPQHRLVRRGLRFIRVLFILAILTSIDPSESLAQAKTPVLDLAEQIDSSHGIRKTSSYESQRFLDRAKATLETLGWFPEIAEYDITLKNLLPGNGGAVFLKVQGENLVAFGSQDRPDKIDLLVVSPYDGLFAGDPDETPVSATGFASAVLLTAAADPQFKNGSTALAMVSGHYQSGAGTAALLSQLENRGVKVRSMVVLGDLVTAEGIPLVFTEKTDMSMLTLAYAKGRAHNAEIFLAGPATRQDWLDLRLSDMRESSPEAMIDSGPIEGSAHYADERGIPTLTIGLPSNGRSIFLERPYDRGSLETKAEAAVAILRSLASTAEDWLTQGSNSGEPQVFWEAFGQIVHFSHRAVKIAGITASGIALVLTLMTRPLVEKTSSPLGIAGLAGALGLAHLATKGSLAFFGCTLISILRPGLSLVLFFSFSLLIAAMGFLRLWRVRSRIALLHSRIVKIEPASTGSDLEKPAAPEHSAGLWAGPWPFAILSGVALGTSLTGSPVVIPSLIAASGLGLALLIELAAFKVPASRKILVWPTRIMYLIPVLPLVFWAGCPTDLIAQRAYAASWSRLWPEMVAQLMACATAGGALLATLRFPGPAGASRYRVIRFTELFCLGALIFIFVGLPRIGAPEVHQRLLAVETVGAVSSINLKPVVSAGFDVVGTGIEDHARASARTVYSKTGRYSLSLPQLPADSWGLGKSGTDVQRRDNAKDIRVTVDLSLRQLPDALVITIQDQLPVRSSQAAPLTIHRLSGLLDDDAMPAIGTHFRPGYQVRVIYWAPVESSLQFTIEASASLQSYMAVSCEASYLGLSARDLTIVADRPGIHVHHTTNAVLLINRW